MYPFPDSAPSSRATRRAARRPATLLLLFLLSCSQAPPADETNVSGLWDVVIQKSSGEENYALAELRQDVANPKFEGSLVFTFANTSDGSISGDASTGRFRIDEIGGDTHIEVAGKFGEGRYSGAYTAYYPSGLVNTGALIMSRHAPPVAVSLEPESVTLERNQTHAFTATVTGTNDTRVSWSATCGSVNQNGLYTAPDGEGACEVRATSLADPDESAGAVVTVLGVDVVLSPATVALEANEARRFTATVTGARDTAVTWSVTGGKLEGSGNTVTYVAPSSGDVYTLTATSQADPRRSASAKIVIKSAVGSADWDSLPNWFTFQADALHTGHFPVTLDPERFVEAWTASFGSTLNPVADGEGQVYVSTNAYFGKQVLYALDATSGDTAWKVDFGDIHSVHPPAVGNGKVYVTTGGHEDTYLWGFGESDGVALLRSPFGNQWSRYYAPTPFGENVYISGGYYGGAYAFEAGSGDELWFTGLNQYDEWTPAVDEAYVYAYTGSYAPQLSVLDRQSGELEFAVEDANFDWSGWSMNSAPVKGSLDNILAVNGGRLISFDLKNRAVGWQLAANFSGQPSVAGGIVYAVNGGSVQARRESDGALQWQWIPTNGNASGTMIVTENLLFVGAEGRTYAVDLTTHRALWDYPAQGHLSLSNEGMLYIATNSGELIAIDVR